MNPADNSAPSPLSKLPDELLLEVLHHLRPIRGFLASKSDENKRQDANKRNVGGLHALSLTAKRFSQLVRPILFEAFIQPSDWTGQSRQILRTLLSNPNLASNIQYIENRFISRERQASDPTGLYDLFPSTAIIALLKNVTPSPFFEQLVDVFWASRNFALELNVLRLLCPNIQDLALCDIDSDEVKVEILHKPRLRRLWLQLDEHLLESKSLYYADNIFMQCLAVSEKLWINRVLSTDHSMDSVKLSCKEPHPHKFQLTELVLDQCEIAPMWLDSILGSCVSLKRFTCRWGIPALNKVPRSLHGNGPRVPPIDLPRLNTALSLHASTLEYLIVDTLESGWQISMEQDVPPMGSLRDYTAMKHLEVAGLVLWGDMDDEDEEDLSIPSSAVAVSQLMPPNLEKLVIWTEWDADVEDALLELARHVPQTALHLKTIDCSWRPATELGDVLVNEFAAAGITLQLQR